MVADGLTEEERKRILQAPIAVGQHIVPLHGVELVVAHLGEGEDDVAAVVDVDVGGDEAPSAGAVLRPVGVVAHDDLILTVHCKQTTWNPPELLITFSSERWCGRVPQ